MCAYRNAAITFADVLRDLATLGNVDSIHALTASKGLLNETLPHFTHETWKAEDLELVELYKTLGLKLES